MIYIYIGQFNPGVFPGMCLLMLKELQKAGVFVYIFNVDFKKWLVQEKCIARQMKYCDSRYQILLDLKIFANAI